MWRGLSSGPCADNIHNMISGLLIVAQRAALGQATASVRRPACRLVVSSRTGIPMPQPAAQS
jgi:hypothetical protein